VPISSLGRRIKTRRVLCWFSQAEFGRRVGVSRRQIAYWESGEDAPSAESLQRICVALSVSADWLLTGRGWLSEVYDLEFYRAQQRRYLKRIAASSAAARLFTALPLDFEAKLLLSIPVASGDHGAVALKIDSSDYSPVFIPGDTLLMRPVNLRLRPDTQPDTGPLARLNDKHVAVVLNGESHLKRLEVKPAAGKSLVTRLHSIGRHSSCSRKTVTLRGADDLLIQAAVYKCVRDI